MWAQGRRKWGANPSFLPTPSTVFSENLMSKVGILSLILKENLYKCPKTAQNNLIKAKLEKPRARKCENARKPQEAQKSPPGDIAKNEGSRRDSTMISSIEII